MANSVNNEHIQNNISIHLALCFCPPDECKFNILFTFSSALISTNLLRNIQLALVSAKRLIVFAQVIQTVHLTVTVLIVKGAPVGNGLYSTY